MTRRHLLSLVLQFVFYSMLLLAVAHAARSAPPKTILPPVPGAINPAVTQATLAATVCVSGWTRTIRPPTSYTNALKRLQLDTLAYADRNPRHYEEDHLVPLSLGGHPTRPANLWPEPRRQADRSDALELRLHRSLCNGTLTLRQARRLILAFKRSSG